MADGIKTELAMLTVSILTGMVLQSGYYSILCVREWIRHSKRAIALEDLGFWFCAAIYVFVQNYYTNHGIIRLDFTLGIVVGAHISGKTKGFFRKMWKKNLPKMEK